MINSYVRTAIWNRHVIENGIRRSHYTPGVQIHSFAATLQSCVDIQYCAGVLGIHTSTAPLLTKK